MGKGKKGALSDDLETPFARQNETQKRMELRQCLQNIPARPETLGSEDDIILFQAQCSHSGEAK